MEKVYDKNSRYHNYSPKEAIEEAKRCLNCKKEFCRTGCPIQQNIPKFVSYIKAGDFLGALQTINEKSNLPSICGRVCPHENQCESKCILQRKGAPINIGKLEKFIGDLGLNAPSLAYPPINLSERVAIIGSGPAGLAAAADLAKFGYNVTVFESEEEPGGVLMYGIPEYRLPKDIVRKAIRKVQELGVQIKTRQIVGEAFSIDDLFKEGFSAVFIASGAGSPRKMKIPGETLPGVMTAKYFLSVVNLVNLGKLDKEELPVKPGDKVVVIGAGNVAMDAAQCAKVLGAEKVTVTYRRTEEDITARPVEFEEAKEAGVDFAFLINPIEFLGKDTLEKVRCVKFELGEPDATGYYPVHEIPGSDFIMEADKAIIAIGQKPFSRIVSTAADIQINDRGYIVTKENALGQTTKDGVFAGGDVVTEPKTVVSAMKQGKMIAQEIHAYLQKKSVSAS